MRLVDRLYDWLSQGPTPDCDRILAAAFEHAEPAWAERIVRVLLRRGHAASWAALIGRYGSLEPSVRDQLHQNPELMQAGTALAVRSTTPETRANALRALEVRPSARMAYVLPDLIRDPTPRIRSLAGHVFRKMADHFLAQPAPPAQADDAIRQAHADLRRQLVLALEEALRTIDLHGRTDVLEVALWFSRDLGDTLWKKLSSHRSRAGAIVREKLRSWNHPRLAHFLVSALARAEWRDRAARILGSWKSLPEVSALLCESELLDDSQIRQHLRSVQSPQWFARINAELGELDPDLWPLVPRWVCHTGYRDSEKTTLLSSWVESKDPRIHHAAVYALAEVDAPGARKLLDRVAHGNSPLASFARWSVVALDTDLVRSAINSRSASAEGTTDSTGSQADELAAADTDCAMLWQACRRTPPQARGELIAALREHAEHWQPRLKSYLQSPDPRDRILVLQIISTERLAPHYLYDLEPLLNDPVEGIRELTRTLVQTLSRQPLPSRAARPAARPDAGSPTQTRESLRRELRTSLERLSTGAADSTDADLIARVRDLLREVYTEQFESDATDAVLKECS